MDARETAKPFPMAAMAKIEWSKNRNATPYGVTVPGPLSEVSFMVKDSKRFPDTNGWGWATFRHDTASDTFKPFGDSAAFAKTCQECHTLVKVRDFVFTDSAKR